MSAQSDPNRHIPGPGPGPAPAAPRRRALAHFLPWAFGALLLAPGLASCGDGEATSAAQAALPGSARAQVDHLLTQLVVPPLDATSDVHDRWLAAKRLLLERLREAEPAVGEEALAVYYESPDATEEVRICLLDVAAHSAPESTRPHLEKLILEYGHSISDRAYAVIFLGETSPERAIELYEPLMKKRKQESTMPEDEFFVRAYIVACRETGHSPVEALADVATNIFKQPYARYAATEELGHHPGRASFNALRAVMLESTGDAYQRRKAAQAIRRSVPVETACEFFREIAMREADLNFSLFMADMIEDLCE